MFTEYVLTSRFIREKSIITSYIHNLPDFDGLNSQLLQTYSLVWIYLLNHPIHILSNQVYILPKKITPHPPPIMCVFSSCIFLHAWQNVFLSSFPFVCHLWDILLLFLLRLGWIRSDWGFTAILGWVAWATSWSVSKCPACNLSGSSWFPSIVTVCWSPVGSVPLVDL